MMMPLMLNSEADDAYVIKRADDASDTCDAVTTVNHHRHQSETPNLQLMKQCKGVPTCRAAIGAVSATYEPQADAETTGPVPRPGACPGARRVPGSVEAEAEGRGATGARPKQEGGSIGGGAGTKA